MFFSTVFEGNLNKSTINGVQIPFQMNYNHFSPFQTISDTFWKKKFFSENFAWYGPPCSSEKNPKKSEFSQNLFKILSRYSGIPGMLQSKFHVPQTILKGVTAIFPKMWKNPVFKEFSKTWSDIDRNSKIRVFMLIQVERRCVDYKRRQI